MTVKFTSACVLLAFAVVPTSLAAQQPQPALARIEGIVLKSGTTEPVSGATVALTNFTTGNPVLRVSITNFSTGLPPAPSAGLRSSVAPAAAPPPPLPTVTSDRDGRFVIADVPAGSYRLTVTGNGFVRQQYGQTVFPGQGTPLSLSAGQLLKDVTLHLIPAGNVSGRLRDENGGPAVDVPVQLLRSVYGPNGQRVLQPSGATRTNDRGEYRIFWATPGRYLIAAGNLSAGTPITGDTAVSANGPRHSYAVSFYPGTVDAASATSVLVSPGNEVTADFSAFRQREFRIRGRVIDSSTGRPPEAIGVSLSYSWPTRSATLGLRDVPYDPATGNFEVWRAPQGPVVLSVGVDGNSARLALNLTGDLDGLSLVMGSTPSVTGSVSIEGARPSDVDKIWVQLISDVGLSPPNATIRPDGTFRFESVVPGQYRAGIFTVSEDVSYYLKDARFGRNDAMNRSFVVGDSTPGGTSLDILVGASPAQLDGTVFDERQQTSKGAIVVLVPARNRERTELFKAATADQNGRFSIKNVVPGDYTLIAWDALENYAYFDPELLRQAEPLGRPLHFDEGASLQQDIRVVRAGR